MRVGERIGMGMPAGKGVVHDEGRGVCPCGGTVFWEELPGRGDAEGWERGWKDASFGAEVLPAEVEKGGLGDREPCGGLFAFSGHAFVPPQLPLLRRIRKPHRDPRARIVPPTHHPSMQALNNLFSACAGLKPDKRDDARRAAEARLEEARAAYAVGGYERCESGFVDAQRESLHIQIRTRPIMQALHLRLERRVPS